MEKVYEFKVTVKEEVKTSGFIQDIINEAKEDEAQMDLTRQINKKTRNLHKEILEDSVESLNKELRTVGLEFNHHEYYGGTNGYSSSMMRLDIPNKGGFDFSGMSYVLIIAGKSNRDFKHSKYTTFDGDFEIKIARNSHLCYTANQAKRAISIYDVSEVVNHIKDDVKEYIKKCNKI